MSTKTKRNIMIFLAIIVVISLLIKFIPFGEKKYELYENINIKVPILSGKGKDCSNDTTKCISFKSYSSKFILDLSLDMSLNDYKRRLCSNNYIYYNKENNLTIYRHEIKRGIFFNKFNIYYDYGNISEYTCMKINNIDEIEIDYNYSYLPNEKSDINSSSYKYLNRDDNLYNVYSDCPDCLRIKSGVGYMSSIREMLKVGAVDMEMIIDKLEDDEKHNQADKEILSNGIMYKNDKIQLIYCNNKNIYVSDKINDKDKICVN